MDILKGKKPKGFEGRPEIWEEEFRIKSLTSTKRGIIKRLTRAKPMEETEA